MPSFSRKVNKSIKFSQKLKREIEREKLITSRFDDVLSNANKKREKEGGKVTKGQKHEPNLL